MNRNNFLPGLPLEPEKMYLRCIIASRTNNDQIYLKLFKVCHNNSISNAKDDRQDVYESKLEHLLPHTKVTMSEWDKAVLSASLLLAATTTFFQAMRYTHHSLVSLQISTVC